MFGLPTRFGFLFGCALAFFVADSAAAKTDLSASWDKGIRLHTADGATKIKLGGRIQQDVTFQRAEDAVETATGATFDDGTELRRLRFYASGTVQKAMTFKVQVDFAGAELSIKDAFVGVKGIPFFGAVTVGHQFEPMTLNDLTSSKYITFIERSTAMAFSPGRNTGILASNHHENVNWSFGLFRTVGDDAETVGDGEYNATGRLGFRPVNDSDSRTLVHLGASGRISNPPGGEVRFRARPETHQTPRVVDTGTIGGVDNVSSFGGELAVVRGPVSVQGEYLQSMVSLDAPGAEDPSFNGFYVFGSVFLTGESRPFSGKNGAFSRVKPKDPFDGEGGKGAWEVAARFSRLNLTDSGVTGGELNTVTVGLNWYPTPNFRWMTNLIHGDVDGVGNTKAAVTRFMADF